MERNRNLNPERTNSNPAVSNKDIIDELDDLMHRISRENELLMLLQDKLTKQSRMETLKEKKVFPDKLTVNGMIDQADQRVAASGAALSMKKLGVKRSLIEELIANETNEEVLDLVRQTSGTDPMVTHVTSTSTIFNIEKIPGNVYENVINLKRINDIRRINKFFEMVNEKLPYGGLYLSCVETYANRKSRILEKTRYPFNWVHYAIDVLVKRVFPKLPLTKKIYFFITKGRNRALSKAETFGRLYSCGFEIEKEEYIGDRLYFVARKSKDPSFPKNPTYGPIIRLRRHGKDGKLFDVYKLRTMHAYSEYLQEYVYKQNDLQDGGKFKDDFRITTEGKLFRKFWLDELPMFINLVKGNMKIVGVRPLSSHYYNLYTEELREKRTRFKPGLIPPFYADMPVTLEEIMESEMKYLEAYEKHPFRTDLKYFLKAWQNILFRHARSN